MYRGGTAGAHPGEAMLHALVDGETTPHQALALARHLGDCDRCRRVRDRLTRLGERIEALPMAEEPEEFTAQVMGRIRTLPAPRRKLRLLRLAAPLALLVGALTALWSGPVPGHLLRGVDRLLHPELRPDLLEMLVGAVAAALAHLGRAAAAVAPRAPTIPGPHLLGWSLPLAFLAAAAFLALLTTSLVMAALAGRGLLHHRHADD